MKKFYYFVQLSLVPLISGCIAGTVVRNSPDPGDPVANFPKYCVGDKIVGFGWSNDITGGDTLTSVVEAVYDDGSFDTISTETKAAKKKFRKYNNKWQLISNKDLTAGKDLPLEDPPGKPLDFPLFVGKRWKDAYTGISVSGDKYDYKSTYTVTDYKEINTEAGKFMAFRIQQEQYNNMYAGSSSKPFEKIYYYAPDAKGIIKSIPSWRIGYEANLVDAKKCD